MTNAYLHVRRRFATALMLLALGVAPAAGQVQQGAVMGSAAGGRTRVHLSTFKPLGTPGEISDIARLVTQVLQLELLRLPIVLEFDSGAPLCGRTSVAGRGIKSDSSGQSQRYDFVIVGDVRSASEQFQAHYDVWQCNWKDSTRKQVIHELRSIPWKNGLTDLIGATRSTSGRLRDLLPRVRVTIETFRVAGAREGTQRETANAAKMRMSEAMWDSDDLQPVDSAGEYVVRSEIQFPGAVDRITPGRDLVVGRVSIRKTAESMAIDTFSVRERSDSLAKFLSVLANRTIERVNLVRFSPGMGSVTVANLPVPRLVELAREALCYTPQVGCRVNRDAAMTALRVAAQRDTTNFAAYFLLGDEAFHFGDRAEAIAVLHGAARIADRARKDGRPVRDSSEMSVLNHLGDGYYAAGNYREANRFYEKSLALDPLQPAAVLGHARSLVELGKRMEAIGLLAGLLEGRRLDSTVAREVTDEFRDALEDLYPDVVLANMQTIASLCRPQELRKSCADALSKVGADLYNAGGSRFRVAAIFRRVDDLGADAYTTSVANAYLALLYLHGSRTVTRDDEMLALFYPGFVADSMSLYLTRAERSAETLSDPSHTDWLLRLRSRYWSAQGAFDRAFNVASEANRKRPTNQGAFLAAEAMFYQGIELRRQANAGRGDSAAQRRAGIEKLRHASALLGPLVVGGYSPSFLYLREANHALRLDTDDRQWERLTRIKLDSLLRKDTANAEAIENLSFVCVEYLQDFECGYRWITERSLALGLVRTVGDSLNAAEAAVLFQRYDVGDRILSAMTDRQATSCRAAVRQLYRVWIAAARGQTDRASAAYAQWEAAANTYRSGSEEVCWVFKGAGERITQERFGDPYKPRLAAMMRAMEKKAAPMP